MSERGSAVLLMVGVVALAMALAAALGVVGEVLRTRSEANAAADAAALAAAPVTFLPFGAAGTAAEEAARFAAANGARLVECRCDADPSWEARTVEVAVERQASLGMFGVLTVRATSRAEFVPALLLTEPLDPATGAAEGT